MALHVMLLLFLAIVTLGAFRLVKYWSSPPLPPGPKGRFPLLGMTFDVPKQRPWVTFTKWARDHGPLLHFRVGLQHFVVIGSPEIERELLSRRANKYSSRPPSKVGEIISGGRRTVLLPYGERWRRMRRVFANVLTAKKCESYAPIQENEAVWTLMSLWNNSEGYADELHRYSLSVARSIAFGERVQSHDEQFAKDVHRYMSNFSFAMTPGRYLFDSIPALRYLPRFMQPWMNQLETFREFETNLCVENYRAALKLAENYPERPCISKDVRREMEALGLQDEEQAGSTCMEILGTGSETTAVSLTWFIMACLLHPKCVKKAQEELDRIVGQDRFPTWQDEANLPYVRAMIKEQHRWRTIAPLSFQHYATEEDVYQGYRIPKGSVVRINTWAMHKDPKRYPEPDEYIPERFLNHPLSAPAYANSSDVAARDHFSYGDGKRICVGIHLAERSLFNLCSHLLHTFNFVRVKDSSGNLIPIDPDATRSGLVMGPLPFPVEFKVRSNKIEELLKREFAKRYRDNIAEKRVSVEQR